MNYLISFKHRKYDFYIKMNYFLKIIQPNFYVKKFRELFDEKYDINRKSLKK